MERDIKIQVIIEVIKTRTQPLLSPHAKKNKTKKEQQKNKNKTEVIICF